MPAPGASMPPRPVVPETSRLLELYVQLLYPVPSSYLTRMRVVVADVRAEAETSSGLREIDIKTGIPPARGDRMRIVVAMCALAAGLGAATAGRPYHVGEPCPSAIRARCGMSAR